MANNNPVQITLTGIQALVLFEWLASLDETQSGPPANSAERTVLWKVEGQLEKALTVVLASDYQEQVAQAKEAVLSEG